MSATQRVRSALARLAETARPELWITIVEEADAIAHAQQVDRRVANGEDLPLAGLVGALKDNIDLAGVPTTAGCPAYAYVPDQSATCVARLVDAGLVIIGKTNLDQFATGLVGTRSPYGLVASASDPHRVGGGSSSGSALAVALGIVDVALGTDTAGSGRVPASFNTIVGLKPTHGLVSTRGIVPACPSLDCVSFFARDVRTAHRAFAQAAVEDPGDPFSRSWSASGARPARRNPVIGVAELTSLAGVDEDRLALYEAAAAHFAEAGAILKLVDVTEMIAAGARLYDGAFVAERYTSVGSFVDEHRDEVDPTVGAIISSARDLRAHLLAGDIVEIARTRKLTTALFADIDVLMLPTTGEHPTLAEVAADPIGVNARLGKFTNFCNLLDLAAIAVPMPTADLQRHKAGATFGLTLFAPAFCDQFLADVAATFLGEAPPPTVGPRPSRVVVVGAHLDGQPLNYQLAERGGRLADVTTTADCYRLFALATEPPKPGLVRVGRGEGECLEVEIWELAPDRFADFTAEVALPLAIGPIELVDGSVVPGFVLTSSEGPPGALDISSFGGWRNFRATLVT